MFDTNSNTVLYFFNTLYVFDGAHLRASLSRERKLVYLQKKVFSVNINIGKGTRKDNKMTDEPTRTILTVK